MLSKSTKYGAENISADDNVTLSRCRFSGSLFIAACMIGWKCFNLSGKNVAVGREQWSWAENVWCRVDCGRFMARVDEWISSGELKAFRIHPSPGKVSLPSHFASLSLSQPRCMLTWIKNRMFYDLEIFLSLLLSFNISLFLYCFLWYNESHSIFINQPKAYHLQCVCVCCLVSDHRLKRILCLMFQTRQ